MKYDIFISYSRNDVEFARKVCAVLDSYKQYYTFEYFFDQSEITSRDEYLKRISYAINDSKVVLFLASQNSYDSEFCAKELLFADKKRRHIHQYCIDDAEMPLEIDMLLGNHQYRELKSTPIDSMVREVLADVLECKVLFLAELGDNSNADCKSDKQGAKLTFTPTNLIKYEKRNLFVGKPLSINAKVSKAYRVGDYYDDGKKKGVVFEVSEDGTHGKIVSFNEENLQWGADAHTYLNRCGKGCKVDTISEIDGRVNTDIIIQRSDYVLFPAFKWCRALGDEWYLPSKYELVMLSKVRSVVNSTLTKYSEREITYFSYWSSTEVDRYRAILVYMYNGAPNEDNKYGNYYVRAVAKF